MANFKKEDIDKLLKKGKISPETFEAYAKRYAQGGLVTDNLVPDAATMTIPTEEEILAQHAAMGQLPRKTLPTIANGFDNGGADTSSLAVQELSKGLSDSPNSVMLPDSGSFSRTAAALEEPEAMVEGVGEGDPQLTSDQQGMDVPQMGQDSALGLMEASVLSNMQADQMEAAATIGGLSKVQQEIIKQEQAMQKLNAERALSLDEQQKKVDLAAQEYANAKVDSGRLWANASTGQKIGMAVSLFLSGVNGSNAGAQILDNAINRDLEAQKADILGKKESFNAQRTMLSDMMERFGDERQAIAAAKLTQIQLAELQVKQQLAKAQGTRGYAEGLQGLAKIQQMKQEAAKNFQFATLASNNFQSNMNFQQQYLSLPEKYQEKAVKLPGNKLGIAINKESAKDVTEKLPAFDGTLSKLRELRQLSSVRFLPTAEKGRAESLAKQILFTVKNLEKTGALDQGTIDVTDKMIGDPNTLWQSSQKARLDSYIKSLENDKENFLGQNLMNYNRLNKERVK